MLWTPQNILISYVQVSWNMVLDTKRYPAVITLFPYLSASSIMALIASFSHAHLNQATTAYHVFTACMVQHLLARGPDTDAFRVYISFLSLQYLLQQIVAQQTYLNPFMSGD